MTRQTRYPVPERGFARAASDGTVLLNGMRVEFSERVPVYPVDLEHVQAELMTPADEERSR